MKKIIYLLVIVTFTSCTRIAKSTESMLLKEEIAKAMDCVSELANSGSYELFGKIGKLRAISTYYVRIRKDINGHLYFNDSEYSQSGLGNFYYSFLKTDLEEVNHFIDTLVNENEKETIYKGVGI